MKKEYNLTISRKDRIYLVIFVSALLGWELIKLIIPFPKSFQNEIEVNSPVAASLPDSNIMASTPLNRPDILSKPDKDIEDNEGEIIKRDLSPVPIMTASVDQLITIGFSKKVAYNIQKYISVGGQIKDEKSLKKIYGIDTNTIRNIIPLIIFPAIETKSDSTFSRSNSSKKEFKPTILDLNSASAEDLESLPGIGAVLADRIVKFRTALGGFTSSSQIKECYGLTGETFELIKSRLSIIQPPIQFSINTIDPKIFSHPYLSKKIMWMLPNYIKNHGPIKNEEALRKVFPPDSNWCNKLLPYVKFE